ncbi:MAG: tail fiber domain-containing protein [Luminiphilus sp.]
MTRTRNLADLLDSSGDVKIAALDNVSATSLGSLGITATSAELNTMDGITATTAELNYVDGVTSAIQTQIDNISTELVNDTTPQLGGSLDVNGNDINFGDSDKAVFGAGSDLQIYHDGSYSYIKESGTGDLRIQGSTNVQIWNSALDKQAANFNAGGGQTLYYDNSAKLATISTGIDVTGNATFDDNGKAIFGAGNDLQIYHDGNNSYIDDAGAGDLFIRASNNHYLRFMNGDYAITTSENSGVGLRFDNSQKLVTTTSGIDVAGNIVVSGSVDGRDVASDGSKLDGIESGATADQTITAGSGLSGGGTGNVTISHADTSSQASSNNSGRTYIQDITLDTYGHVTGIATATETVVNTNTTYSADGNYGMTLSGTTFRLENDRRRNDTGADVYSGNTHDYTFYDASVGIRWYTAGAEEMRLENDGDLHVDGNITAYSTTVSDPRLKEDIQPVTDALAKVEKLNGYTFTYKHDGSASAGVVSTEVADVLPSAIKKSKVPLVAGHDNETEYDIVQYDQLHALLIEAVKELSERVKELENDAAK